MKVAIAFAWYHIIASHSSSSASWDPTGTTCDKADSVEQIRRVFDDNLEIIFVISP